MKAAGKIMADLRGRSGAGACGFDVWFRAFFAIAFQSPAS